jgi:hypothetical protein
MSGNAIKTQAAFSELHTEYPVCLPKTPGVNNPQGKRPPYVRVAPSTKNTIMDPCAAATRSPIPNVSAHADR